MRLWTLCFLLLALLLVGCGKKAEVPASDNAAATQKAGDPVAAPEAVSLTAEGTNFDPPIAKGQLPKGAWYCDMGTVHYACLDKKDGNCPRCKRDLKHRQ